MTYDEALDKLRRIFPGHEVTVYDGVEGAESGLVEDTEGQSVASFCLTLKEQPQGQLPKVKKLRVGPPGQFNGSPEDFRAYHQAHGDPVYLDYNATTPLDPRVLEAMTPWFLTPSNSGSRSHSFGQKAKDAVENARRQVAELLNAPPEEIFFTSGATESNNLAILGLVEHGERTGRRHIISTAIEHKAVLEPLDRMRQLGFEVELAPVTAGGYVEPDAIKKMLRPDTLLISVMHANNETGVLQPVHEIAELLRGTDTLFHTDAAQTFGKEVPALRELKADLVSISGHKIHAPQGVGALLVRRRGGQKRAVQPLLFGGGQERGLRPGTVPVALVVGLGEAARLAGLEWESRRASVQRLREQLLLELGVVEHHINGDSTRCLPHVVNVSFPGLDSEALMMARPSVTNRAMFSKRWASATTRLSPPSASHGATRQMRLTVRRSCRRCAHSSRDRQLPMLETR
jgi:cysteine desulfurase